MVDPSLIRAWHARRRLVRAAEAEQSQPRSPADKLAAVARLRAFGRRHTRGRGDDEAAVCERFATLRSRMATPPAADPLHDALAALARWLDAAGVPYALIGGLAVSLQAEPQFTEDVDAVIWGG